MLKLYIGAFVLATAAMYAGAVYNQLMVVVGALTGVVG